MSDTQKQWLRNLIDNTELDKGIVYRIGDTWYVDGKRWELNRPRIGRNSSLTISYDNLVIVEQEEQETIQNGTSKNRHME